MINREHATVTSSGGVPVVGTDMSNDNENENDNDIASPDAATSRDATKKTNQSNTSVWFALSLTCNACLLVYAHVGLSAVILSNQERIVRSPSGSNTGNTGNDDSNDSSVDLTNSTNTSGNNTGACVASDIERWTVGLGAVNKSRESNHCARHFYGANNQGGCLLDVNCHIECMTTVFRYTPPCATCFADIPLCSLSDGCAFVCQQDDGTSAECLACTVDCNDKFATCSGLDLSYITASAAHTTTNTSAGTNTTTSSNETDTSTPPPLSSVFESSAQVCARQQGDIQDIWSNDETKYHVVYEIQFLAALKTAWTSNAPWLAIIVAGFSGVWPYLKLAVMGVVYYVYGNDNSTARSRQGLLICRWLRRWGKYTLVDIYVVIVILVGVALPIVVAGNVPVIIKGEPRGAIIAFLGATMWSFGQLEWMMHAMNRQEQQAKTADDDNRGANVDDEPLEEQQLSSNGVATDTTPPTTTNTTSHSVTARNVLDGLRFATVGLPAASLSSPRKIWADAPTARLGLRVLLLVSTGLLVAGSCTELIRFTSILGGEAAGCDRRYNLFTLGGVLVSDFLTTGTSGGATQFSLWILYLAYLVCIGVVPLLVHGVYLTFFFMQVPIAVMAASWIFAVTHVAWTVASIEVLLLALFALQRKFDELIAALAGNDGSQFFGIESQLGPGFYILLVYCFVGGASHYLLDTALQQHLHPTCLVHQTDMIWTKILRCFLVDEKEGGSKSLTSSAR